MALCYFNHENLMCGCEYNGAHTLLGPFGQPYQQQQLNPEWRIKTHAGTSGRQEANLNLDQTALPVAFLKPPYR